MASFDVTSLFTNIPVDETIEIITNRLFSNCCRFHGLTRSDFIKLLSNLSKIVILCSMVVYIIKLTA